MFYDKEKIKIVNQGIDTLVLGIKCIESKVYNARFKYLKFKLSDLKNKAKSINTYGEKFVKDDLDLKLGNFLISSKGVQGYSYLFKNNDIFVSVSNAKFETKKQYHIKIQFRSEFLLKFGYLKCFSFVKILLNRIFYTSLNYKIYVLRLDLATDITGIRYFSSDIFNFRSLSKVKNFSLNYDDYLIEDEKKIDFPNLSEIDVSNFIRFNRFEGISFGKAPMMFRIYDKIKEVLKKDNSRIIFKKWEINGFDIEKDKFVFRHECEFTREVLKKMIPFNCEDEIKFVFNNLSAFWSQGLNICRWYDLNEIELKKIQLQSVKPDSIRKIYERCLKDETRFNFWRFLEIWYNDDLKNLQKRDIPFDVNIEKCKVALKSFVSSVYCNLGYRGAFFDVLKEVLNDLKNDDMTLHDYGLLKLASRFADNEKNYEISEFENLKLQNIFENNLKDFFILLDDLSDNKDKNIVKKALNFYKLKK